MSAEPHVFEEPHISAYLKGEGALSAYEFLTEGNLVFSKNQSDALPIEEMRYQVSLDFC